MLVNSYSQLIFLLLSIICYNVEGNTNRHRRQIIDNSNRNIGVQQEKPVGSIPLNNVPFQPSNNPKQINNNAVSQSQIEPIVRSAGYYNSPSFQPPPFSGEKPLGWFGTNHANWVSNQNSEVDKNKLAADKYVSSNNPQVNFNPPQREDGGPQFLRKVAKQYASQGEKGFNFGPYENRQGVGSVCSNHENFDGYVFGTFSCPLPASTGMNQLDQFCCGHANYQYCCNAQEYSYTQRSGYSDNQFIGDQRFPKQSYYSPSTKRILTVILPIAGFIVLTGIGVLVFLYYKKFRKEQNRTRKPAGSIRLEDTYSIVPQEPSNEKSMSFENE